MFHSDRMGAMRRSFLAAAASISLLSACAGTAEVEPKREIATQPPPGAIKVEEDLYMLDIGLDNHGCRQYTAWSATRTVLAVVYYRQKDGKFTTFRSRSECGK